VFVLEKNLKKDGSYQYYSVKGKLSGVNCPVGTVIIGKIGEIKESYIPVFIVEKELLRIRIPFYSFLMAFRDNTVEKLYYGSNKKISLIPAMFYGDKRYIPPKDIENFTIAGLNHILAISGQHVGIIVMIIFLFLYRLPFKINMLIASVLILLFVPLAGFKIPVLRAAVFVVIITIAYLFDMKVNLNKLVLWVASLFIIVDPDIISSPSFVLSFLAVYGISQIDKSMFNHEKILSGVLVGLYATIFTMPYILQNFGMINILSFLNSILITPFATAIILLGIISVINVELVIPIGIFLEKITYQFVEFLGKVTDFAFIFKNISDTVAVFTIVLLFLISFFRCKYILLSSLLILFFPTKSEKVVVFPYLEHSKGYYIVGDKQEVFFKGSPYEFRYNFLTQYIKDGGKRKIEFGDVDIGYDSKFLKIKNVGVFQNKVCIDSNGCKIILITNKKIYQKLNLVDNKSYITFSKSIQDPKVLKVEKGGKRFRLTD
jgi:competence protein ComEC